jgi:hypothetical protein
MGVYFSYTPNTMAYSPSPFSFFDAYVYIHQADVYFTAIEYQLLTPSDPTHALLQINSVEYPDNMSVQMGDPFAGHSITYWPPSNGYVPGYNLVVKYSLFTTVACWDEGGGLMDYPLVIGPHPDSGELRGTYYPDNLFFPIVGLTSILCPFEYATEETTWGAIKSQYK